MDTKTQCEQVLQHLLKFGVITPQRAESEYGIMRLAARVNDLRNAGYAIRTEEIRGVNRFGRPTRFAQYRIDATITEIHEELSAFRDRYVMKEPDWFAGDMQSWQ